MQPRDFTKVGFITAGNPNHYDGSGLLLRELRLRAREDDAPQLQGCVRDLEEWHKGEYGRKLTEADATRVNLGDQIADYLSDAAPEGFVFEVRKDDQGNSNWGYFPKETRHERG